MKKKQEKTAKIACGVTDNQLYFMGKMWTDVTFQRGNMWSKNIHCGEYTQSVRHRLVVVI